MESLLERVRRTVRRRGLLAAGDRVLVAVSGGSDSVALLHLLRRLAGPLGVELAGVAHLHHGMRGDEAEADEAFCRALATQAGLSFESGRVDVPALARARRSSLEDAARHARYDFLLAAADRLRADRVAVGHTKNDQAETLLLRLLRGAGTRGLGAIHPVHGRIVRPLIDTTRQELRDYLAAAGLGFRDDATNADVRILRNHIRHELLPAIAARFGEGIVSVLARHADIAREDAAWLDEAAAAAGAPLIARGDSGVALGLAGLRALPPAMRRRVVREALETAAGQGRFIGFDHVAALLDAVEPDGPARLDLPGQRVERRGDRLLLRPKRTMPPRQESFLVELPVPGAIEAAGWTVTAARGALETAAPAGDERAVLDARDVALPLRVRSRRAGDAIRLPGGRGRKKLQDLFVDAKVPRDARDTVPVVTAADERIVWVVGHLVSGDFGVTGHTADMLTLTARRSGGRV